MSQYEEMTIDRREKYFEDSAKFRNDEHDFCARYNRGEEIIKDMRRRLIEGINWHRHAAKVQAEKANVSYVPFRKKA